MNLQWDLLDEMPEWTTGDALDDDGTLDRWNLYDPEAVLRKTIAREEIIRERLDTARIQYLFDQVYRDSNELQIPFREEVVVSYPEPPAKVVRIPSRVVNPKLRFQIFKRDGYHCCICGATALDTKLQVDHIIPVSAGGPTIEANLMTLCFECNIGKGAQAL